MPGKKQSLFWKEIGGKGQNFPECEIGEVNWHLWEVCGETAITKDEHLLSTFFVPSSVLSTERRTSLNPSCGEV